MSRHISRRQRWTEVGANEHRSVEGLVVRRIKGQWWADIAYEVLDTHTATGEVLHWQPHFERLGPFRRPRNAMVEAERHLSLLRNRHGEWIRLDRNDPSSETRSLPEAGAQDLPAS